MDETFRRVSDQLRKISGRAIPITPDTEIYRDLGIYGDDIAFDVVLWATHEFGMEGKFPLTNYAPAEHSFPWLRKLLLKVTGRKQRQYESLTVRAVVAMIEAKRWPV